MQALPANLQPHVVARDAATAIHRKRSGPSRKAYETRQLAAIGIPAYAADLSIRRGRCFKCKARYSVQRATFDYTSAKAVEPFCHVECAKCGHVWYRTAVPRLGEYQSIRLTIILPSTQSRWFARGRWHVQGETAIVIDEAHWSDLMDAATEWRKRNTHYEMARARVKARKVERDLEAVKKSHALIERLHAMDAARAAEEEEAASRSN